MTGYYHKKTVKVILTIGLALLVACACLCGTLASFSMPGRAITPEAVSSASGPFADGCGGSVDTFKSALEQLNVTVQEGEIATVDIIKLYDEGVFPSCYYNNPSTPYMVYQLPDAPGQNWSSEFKGQGGLSPEFLLAPNEAIVYLGKTPPNITYYSYRSYLSRRYFPEIGHYRRIYASLGDTINNMNVCTTGTPDGNPGNPYNQTTVIITTADCGTEELIRQALSNAGYSPAVINLDIIPSSMVKMGLTKGDDTFTFLIRLAFFLNESEKTAFLQQPDARVFRITPNTTQELDPHPMPVLKVRGTGVTEFDLAGDLHDLRQALIEESWANYTITEYTTSLWIGEGFDAIQRGIDAYGETRDTVYLRSEELYLDEDELLIVYGVNHAATGKATYANFGVFGIKAQNGVGAVSNLAYNGTANQYLPTNPNASSLYVYTIARNQSERTHCLEIPYDQGARGVDLNVSLFVAFRAYMEPATAVGPNHNELIYDQVMKLSPRSTFDTGPGTYPSIAGIHNGTIIPEWNLSVDKLYTYFCPGTGGHTEYLRIWNNTGWNVSATWVGYDGGDWHNLTFNNSFTLYANQTYSYTIRTCSYPQIIHAQSFNATGGVITCTSFVDINGKQHEGWIPAIRLS
ncbi:MAG: hypothetical protein ACP5E9_05695 [Candidatus Methanospirareceae archaeon]